MAILQSLFILLKTDSEYKLFVPSFWTTKNICICSGEVYIDDYKENVITLSNGERIEVIQSQLDAIFIDTNLGDLSCITKEASDEGTMDVVTTNGDVLYRGLLESIKGRGNTTWQKRQKKPYKIKLHDKCQLFGLNKSKKFNLLADDFDQTKLKNWLALKIAEDFGIRYPVHGHHVSVWINGLYNGLYLLTESIDIGKDCIDIHDLEKETLKLNGRKKFSDSDMTRFDYDGNLLSDSIPISKSALSGILDAKNPTDISGGYVFEFLPWTKEPDNKFCTPYASLCLKSPKYPTIEQIQYAKHCMTAMLRSVIDSRDYDSVHPSFEKYINIDSYARYYIYQELLYSCDACYASTFHVKDRNDIDSLFYAAPVWDFDISMNPLHDDVEKESRCYILRPAKTGRILLFPDLFRYKAFRDTVQSLYYSQLSPILHSFFDTNVIDSISMSLSKDVMMDQLRWNEHYMYHEEVGNMVSFMKKRIAFVDNDLCKNKSDYYVITIDTGSPRTFEWHVQKGDSFSFIGYLPSYERLESIVNEDGIQQNMSIKPTQDAFYRYKWRELNFWEKVEYKLNSWKENVW